MASMLRHAGVVADRAAPSRAMVGGTCAASVSIPRGGAGRVAERASVRWNRYPAGTASPSGRGDAVAARSTDGASSSAASSDESPARLVLYTKPGCCLCDGLKETLDEVLASETILASAPALRGASLELRDVSTNEEWAAKHAMEVPVLHLRDDDGDGDDETPLPRPAPRLSAARLAIRLGQDVADARGGGDGGSSRKGWSVSTGGGAAGGAATPSSGGGWSVVSDKGW
jgi:hypothetical protein